MDLGILSEKLKKDSITYYKEFEAELDTLESIIRLQKINNHQLRPLLAFTIRNGHINKDRTWKLLKETLSQVKDVKIRRSILIGAIVFRQKKFISSTELFRTILIYGSDLKSYFKGCSEFVDNNCYDVLFEWYCKGIEKQKSFCYYFLLIIFSKNIKSKNIKSENMNKFKVKNKLEEKETKDVNNSLILNKKNEINEEIRNELEKIICESLFGFNKLTKICLLYFSNKLEIECDILNIKNGYEYGKRLYFELTKTIMEREIKIKKSKIYVLFKKAFNIKNSITKMLMNMIDVEKEDLGDILNCLIKSVEEHEALDMIKMISEEFVNEGKDDDIACYGMNVLRELYGRFAGIIYQETDSNEKNIEFSDLNNVIDNQVNKIENNFLKELKDTILDYISIFSGNHNKSINFAYKSVIKTVVYGEIVDKDATFILKSKTKEERLNLRTKNKEERNRERAQEQYQQRLKKNRKGKVNKRKNRLFIVKKKSNRS